MIEKYSGKIRKSKKDPRFTGYLLIGLDDAPDHPQFPKVDRALCPPNTYYRFDTASQRVTTMVTILPDGTHVAWFTCGACSAAIHICRCGSKGISAGRSIEYIYDQTVATMAGEEWSIHHPNYGGSLRKALKGAARPHWGNGGQVARPIAKKAAEGPSKPRRSLTRSKPEDQKPSEFNMGEVDKAAAASAESSTKELESKLSRKKAEPNKSKLTRKKKDR